MRKDAELIRVYDAVVKNENWVAALRAIYKMGHEDGAQNREEQQDPTESPLDVHV